MKLQDLLHIDLSAIDQKLQSVVDSDPELTRPSVVYDSIMNLIRAGGKRLRPMMVVVGGRFGDPALAEKVLRTAVLFEYIHMASLIHDDIIDQSDLRRGKPTLHKTTDLRTAIHVANYMMARVVEWSSMNDKEELNEEDAYRCAEIAAIVTELCLGEFKQLDNRFDYALTMEQYLDKTRRKTALLMAECFKEGAKAANADQDVCQRLFRYGESLGIAFQIQDDVLDFTKPKEAIGKPAGADLKSGNITLPVMLALQDQTLGPRIRRLNEITPESEMQEVISLISDSGAIKQSLEVSRNFAKQAQEWIQPLSDHPSYHDLQIFIDYFMQPS